MNSNLGVREWACGQVRCVCVGGRGGGGFSPLWLRVPRGGWVIGGAGTRPGMCDSSVPYILVHSILFPWVVILNEMLWL